MNNTNYLQVGETIACGHCEPEKYGASLKFAQERILNFKCTCKCHVISKIKEDFPGLPEKMQQIDSTEN